MDLNSDLLNNPLLNDVAIYNILLQSDISDTINLCSLNDRTKKICNNYFWKKKYLYDDLPIVNSSPLSWLNEYSKVYKAKQLAIDIVILADQECNLKKEGSVSLGIDLYHNENYHLFLPKNLINIIDSKIKDIDVNNTGNEECMLIFNKNTDDPDYLFYIILDALEDSLISELIEVNYDIFRETLFYLFYYYPDIDVTNDFGISYVKEKMNFEKLSQLYEEFEDEEFEEDDFV